MIRPRASAVVGILILALAPSGPTIARKQKPPKPPPTWQMLIGDRDRERLRDWRQAWLDGLGQARFTGNRPRIDAEGALLQPDAALNDPAAPDGEYRCRTIKLGARVPGGQTFVAFPAATCRIGGGGFVKLDGAQRPAGLLWTFDGVRLLFLGAMALGDERQALPYGRDRERDMVGMLERIGPRRWRLVLPHPQWESQIDVIELVPAQAP